jgi:hypothetical protein
MKFDPVAICSVLSEHGVKYVVLGGFAAVIHGSPVPTEDIDVIPSRHMENLGRLADALKTMNAAIRTSDGPAHTRIDAAYMTNMTNMPNMLNMLNLVTDHGDVDLIFNPAGGLSHFEEWNERADSAQLEPGLVVAVAARDDIIASKSAANRLMDQRSLPYLESLRDELRRQSEE